MYVHMHYASGTIICMYVLIFLPELDLSRLQAGLSVTGWVATSVKGSAALGKRLGCASIKPHAVMCFSLGIQTHPDACSMHTWS